MRQILAVTMADLVAERRRAVLPRVGLKFMVTYHTSEESQLLQRMLEPYLGPGDHVSHCYEFSVPVPCDLALVNDSTALIWLAALAGNDVALFPQRVISRNKDVVTILRPFRVLSYLIAA